VALEGLKDQIKDQLTELAAKIQEHSLYQTARERFESQTIQVQRAIVIGGSLLAAAFLLSFPLGYISSSNDQMAIFEENRTLIQGLLRASRSSKESSPLPPPMSSDQLRSAVDRVLRDQRLVPEQIGEMQAIPGDPTQGLAPAMVIQTGLAAQIKRLNLSQVVAIATSMQNLGAGTKLIGLDVVQSTGQTHYYDMNVRVVNFGLPTGKEDSGDHSEPTKATNKRGRNQKPPQEETAE